MPPTEDPLLTYEDARKQLKISLRTVKQLVYDGKIAAIRLSPRNIRIRQSALNAYIERRAAPSIHDAA